MIKTILPLVAWLVCSTCALEGGRVVAGGDCDDRVVPRDYGWMDRKVKSGGGVFGGVGGPASSFRIEVVCCRGAQVGRLPQVCEELFYSDGAFRPLSKPLLPGELVMVAVVEPLPVFRKRLLFVEIELLGEPWNGIIVGAEAPGDMGFGRGLRLICPVPADSLGEGAVPFRLVTLDCK